VKQRKAFGGIFKSQPRDAAAVGEEAGAAAHDPELDTLPAGAEVTRFELPEDAAGLDESGRVRARVKKGVWWGDGGGVGEERRVR
jgi:hypothetical protein